MSSPIDNVQWVGRITKKMSITALESTLTLRTAIGTLVIICGSIWALRRAIHRIRVKSLIRNLPGPKNESWITGNFPEIYDVLNFKWHYDITEKYDGIFQINGMFGDEQLYITDSRAMHQVLVKEQEIFEEPQSLLIMNRVLLGNGLLATLGSLHKKQRRVLNPVFSAKHMRELVNIFLPISRKLCSSVTSQLRSVPTEVDMYMWTSRGALEFIAQGGLGTSLDTLKVGEISDYTKLVKEMVPIVSRLHVAMQILPLVYPIVSLIPTPVLDFLLRYAPFSAVRELKRITDQLEDTSREVLQRSRTAVSEELELEKEHLKDDTGARSCDILSALLRAQHDCLESERLQESELMGQITTLIFAAQDTTSSAVSRILHVLTAHTETQSELRKAIRKARESLSSDEKWDYDTLMHIPLLDAVVRETLRLYNPVSWIWRIAREETTLPLRKPISIRRSKTNENGHGHDQDDRGETVSRIPVAKGQGIVIGIAASHRDKSIWGAHANEWKPENWLENRDIDDLDEEKESKISPRLGYEDRYPGIYSGMMSFSGGGRSCIGFKFAILAIKLLVAELIDQFEFSAPDGEIIWNMNHIAAPTVLGREKEGAQMPLKVSLAT